MWQYKCDLTYIKWDITKYITNCVCNYNILNTHCHNADTTENSV